MKIYYDLVTNLIVLEGVNRQFQPLSLSASNSGNLISIYQIGQTTRLVGPIAFNKLKRGDASTFSNVSQAMTYLNQVFSTHYSDTPVVTSFPDDAAEGDFVVKDGEIYVYDQGVWEPVNRVFSVAGKTGVVQLTNADVGLSRVDNTSDVEKPISTAVQTALNNKLETSQLPRGFSFSAPGKTLENEKWPVISPYSFTVVNSHSLGRAGVAATGTATFTFKRGSTTLGTAVFAPGAFTATINFTSPSIAENDLIVIFPPTTPDLTLADIAFSIRS